MALASVHELMALLGKLAGWIGGHPLEFFGGVALATLVAYVSVQVDRALRPAPEQPAPDTVQVERPMTAEDLVDATIPDQVTEYEAPGSTDTRTDCIEVPTWMRDFSPTSVVASDKQPSTHDRGERRIEDSPAGADSSGSTSRPPTSLTSNYPRAAGPPYFITPSQEGRPTLSVGSKRVTLSAIDPRTGAGREYTYEVPEDHWTIAPSIGAETTAGGPVASAGASLSYKSVSLGAAYEVAPEARGWTVGITWTPFTVSW